LLVTSFCFSRLLSRYSGVWYYLSSVLFPILCANKEGVDMNRLWAPWRMSYVSNLGQDEKCVFCKAAQSDNPRKVLVLFRTEYSLAMLNRYPYTNGHLMVAPLRHTADLNTLDDHELLDLMLAVRRCQNLLEDAAAPHGFNIGLNIGRDAGAGIIDHLHVHIVPRWAGDTNFMTVLGDVRVIPDGLMMTYDHLATVLKAERPAP